MSEIAELSFEQTIAALEHAVRQIESGQIALAELVAVYKKAQALSHHASELLDAAQNALHAI